MQLITDLKDFFRQRKRCKDSNVVFYNFWEFTDIQEMWLYRFMLERKILPQKNKRMAFFSVMGPRKYVRWDHSDIKIFFTGENVTRNSLHPLYHDHLLNQTDLSLGFEYLNADNYLRFPLWLLYFIEPGADFHAVSESFRNLQSAATPRDHESRDFCALVARHDVDHIRENMYHAIRHIAPVDCAGKLLNNTDRLYRECHNDKMRFLQKYRFNICPENTDVEGYVTEKIFEAIQSGCVPVYWGSNNNPEPEVLNPDAILFWEPHDNQERTLRQIETLYASPRKYAEFIAQPRFRPQAAQYTFEMMQTLENRLKEIIRNQ